jgi:nucleotide-binding universal stress UspA family protein
LHADLVVLGGWGEHEAAVMANGLGETALKVAERSRRATLLVKREALMPYGRVLGCARGAATDRVVLEWAMRLAPEDLVHVVSAYSVAYERRLVEWGASPSTLDVYAGRDRDARNRILLDLLTDLAIPAARVRLQIERGEPLETILNTATQSKADLVIVGRRAGVESLAPGPFGSVARQVALRAAVDVLVVPPPSGAVAL